MLDHVYISVSNPEQRSTPKAWTTEVDATYAAALAAGGTDDGAPGPRPQFAEGYYAANFTDFDGNQFEIVNKSWAPGRS